VGHKEHSPVELQIGQLNGRMVGTLEGLFSVCDKMQNVHEVALVVLLLLKGPAKPSDELEMSSVEINSNGKGKYVIPVADIEGIAYLILLEEGRS